MNGTRINASVVDEWLQRAAAGDARGGRRLALGLLDSGTAFDDIIAHLLAAGQNEVGQRWMRNEWTIVEEHLASGVVQKTLDALASAQDVPSHRGRVVVACAEGDWHSLPAQMFAERLAARGFTVDFLGASSPSAHVASFLRRRHADALVVSCTIPLYYGGVARLVDAAHSEGVPVLAGGRAMGESPDRAAALGADAWAGDLDTAAEILDGWHLQAPTVSNESIPVNPLVADLEMNAPLIAAQAYLALRTTFPPMASYDAEQRSRTLEDLTYICQFLAAAHLVNDEAVFTDFVAWLQSVLGARDVPPTALGAGLAVITPIVSGMHPSTRATLEAALARVPHPAVAPDAESVTSPARETPGPSTPDDPTTS
jgi:methanogenic corrinoid protein MtbC1